MKKYKDTEQRRAATRVTIYVLSMSCGKCGTGKMFTCGPSYPNIFKLVAGPLVKPYILTSASLPVVIMSTLAQIYKRPIDTIRPEHLSHITGERNYSHIHFTDGSRTLFGKTLKLFEVQYPYLVRVAKSLVVNFASIADWERVDKKTMWVMVDGTKHWVSWRRIDKVIAQLTETLMNS